MSRKLTDFEKQVYDFIKEHDEMIVSSVPRNMRGAIPNLKNAGLLQTYRKPTTHLSPKKKTFVKVTEQNDV